MNDKEQFEKDIVEVLGGFCRFAKEMKAEREKEALKKLIGPEIAKEIEEIKGSNSNA